jgi:hypothetical protein
MMEPLKIEPTDDSPEVLLDKEGGIFRISGKSLPEDVVDFYQPVLDWLNRYSEDPNPDTEFIFKLVYFNTASSKLILDLMMILESMVEGGLKVKVRWMALSSDEDMQEAGKEYEEMMDIPFVHETYDL